MSRGQDLYHLQTLDREDEAKRRRLAEVENALKDTTGLDKMRRLCSEATALARRSTARQTDLELELESLVGRIAREDEKLYGGTVKNPKELQELQTEIGSLRRRQREMEDALLDAMVESEEAEESLDTAQKELDAAEARFRGNQEALLAEGTSLRRRLAEIAQERGGLTGRMSASDLATYEGLRRRKGGVAVALTSSDTCGACGVAVSPNRLWHLREGELVQCGNCERILVLA